MTTNTLFHLLLCMNIERFRSLDKCEAFRAIFQWKSHSRLFECCSLFFLVWILHMQMRRAFRQIEICEDWVKMLFNIQTNHIRQMFVCIFRCAFSVRYIPIKCIREWYAIFFLQYFTHSVPPIYVSVLCFSADVLFRCQWILNCIFQTSAPKEWMEIKWTDYLCNK